MSFVPLTDAETATGKPVTQSLVRKIKDNFDDLDQRITFRTGDFIPSLDDSARVGWIPALDDGTIGNAASGSSIRANADTEALFTLIWNRLSNTEAPTFDSAGTPVARGASAAADFAADRRIQIGTYAGRVLGFTGQGSGLTNRGIGDVVGAQTQGLSGSNNGVHNHPITTFSGNSGGLGPSGTGSGGSGPDNSAIQNSGSGTAHNNIQPTVFLDHFIKL